MARTKSPWGHLKALEMYKLVQQGGITEYEFGEWLVEKLVDAHMEGRDRATRELQSQQQDNHN